MKTARRKPRRLLRRRRTTPPRGRALPYHFRPRLEQLEERQLLSGWPSIDWFKVDGTDISNSGQNYGGSTIVGSNEDIWVESQWSNTAGDNVGHGGLTLSFPGYPFLGSLGISPASDYDYDFDWYGATEYYFKQKGDRIYSTSGWKDASYILFEGDDTEWDGSDRLNEEEHTIRVRINTGFSSEKIQANIRGTMTDENWENAIRNPPPTHGVADAQQGWQVYPYYIYIDAQGPYAPRNLDMTDRYDTGRSDDDEITRETNPRFEWSKPGDRGPNGGVAGTDDYYRWRVYNSSGELLRSDTTSSAHVRPGSLGDGNYVFWVQARDNVGNWGTWEDLSFRIDTNAPRVPGNLRVDGGDPTLDRTPVLDWNSVSGAYRYYVEVENWWWINYESGWTTSSHYQVQDDLPLGTIYWKVKSQDMAGNESAFSARDEFDVVQPHVVDVRWERPYGTKVSEVSEDDRVYMVVKATGFSTGDSFSADIVEGGLSGHGEQFSNLTVSHYSGNIWRGTWDAVWMKDTWHIIDQNHNPEYYFELDTYGNTSGELKVRDNTPPGEPSFDANRSSHQPNVWSNDADLDIWWTEPADNAGIEGYSVELTNSPTTIPEPPVNSPSRHESYNNMGDSDNLWVHVRAVDYNGNWARPEDVAHFGPFKVDTEVPTAPSGQSPGGSSPDNPPVLATTTPPFDWNRSDGTGSEVAGYTLDVDYYYGHVAGLPIWRDTERDVDVGDRTDWSLRSPLDPNKYRWRVHVTDTAGNPNVSDWRYFEIVQPFIRGFTVDTVDTDHDGYASKLTFNVTVNGGSTGIESGLVRIAEDDWFFDDPIVPIEPVDVAAGATGLFSTTVLVADHEKLWGDGIEGWWPYRAIQFEFVATLSENGESLDSQKDKADTQLEILDGKYGEHLQTPDDLVRKGHLEEYRKLKRGKPVLTFGMQLDIKVDDIVAAILGGGVGSAATTAIAQFTDFSGGFKLISQFDIADMKGQSNDADLGDLTDDWITVWQTAGIGLTVGVGKSVGVDIPFFDADVTAGITPLAANSLDDDPNIWALEGSAGAEASAKLLNYDAGLSVGINGKVKPDGASVSPDVTVDRFDKDNDMHVGTSTLTPASVGASIGAEGASTITFEVRADVFFGALNSLLFGMPLLVLDRFVGIPALSSVPDVSLAGLMGHVLNGEIFGDESGPYFRLPNAMPVIERLSDTPDPVTPPENLILTADGVSDPDGSVTKVEFYLDSNNNGSLDAGADQLLGSDNASGGGWNWVGPTGALPTGTNRYFARVQDDDGAWSNAAATTGTINPPQNEPPRITAVVVRGSEWSTSFSDTLDGQDLGEPKAPGLGYRIPEGDSQLATLPWSGVDELSIVFSEEVEVRRNDLALRSVNGGEYAVDRFYYNPATFSSTWTLADPIGPDTLLIALSDNVRDAAGYRLDGEWENGVDSFPSGNNVPGGNLDFRFNVLPGDGDRSGTVDISDGLGVRQRLFRSAGEANYTPFYDFDGSGMINVLDGLVVRRNVFGLVVTPTELSVPEGGTAQFSIALTSEPPGTVTITTTRTNGDEDLSVEAGGRLTFDKSNWDDPQLATIAAADDADTAKGTAEFTVTAGGATNQPIVTATEDDDDSTSGVSIALDFVIPTSGPVGGIGLSPDNSRLYAAFWEDSPSSRVQEWSLPSDQLLQTIEYGSYHTHGDVVVSADGTRIFTTNYYKSDVSQIELDNGNARTDLSSEDSWPGNIDITPDRTKALAAVGMDGRDYDMNNDSIAIYNVTGGSFELLGSVKLDDEPQGRKIAFSPDSEFAYVVTRARKSDHAKLYEISLTGSYEVTRTVQFADVGTLRSVAVADGKVYVGGPDDPKLWVVDTGTWTVVSEIDLSDAPGTSLVHPGGEYLFVLLPDVQAVTVLDIGSEQVVNRYDGLQVRPRDIEFNSDGSKMYVSHHTGDGNVWVFDVETGPVVDFADEFDDAAIDTELWAYDGTRRGWGGDPRGGSWGYSHDQSDGRLEMRVNGPTSGLTYGAEAWVRSTYDYNDGQGHLVNFEWDAEVAEYHYNHYLIQITDGYVPEVDDLHWPTREVQGTSNLLWSEPPGGGDLRRGASLHSTNELIPEGSPEAWSIVIDPAGTGGLYNGPDGTGTLLREELLPSDQAWHVRIMVSDGTSAGFPAGDARLNLYSFSSVTLLADQLQLGGEVGFNALSGESRSGAVKWRGGRGARQSLLRSASAPGNLPFDEFDHRAGISDHDGLRATRQTVMSRLAAEPSPLTSDAVFAADVPGWLNPVDTAARWRRPTRDTLATARAVDRLLALWPER